MCRSNETLPPTREEANLLLGIGRKYLIFNKSSINKYKTKYPKQYNALLCEGARLIRDIEHEYKRYVEGKAKKIELEHSYVDRARDPSSYASYRKDPKKHFLIISLITLAKKYLETPYHEEFIRDVKWYYRAKFRKGKAARAGASASASAAVGTSSLGLIRKN